MNFFYSFAGVGSNVVKKCDPSEYAHYEILEFLILHALDCYTIY